MPGHYRVKVKLTFLKIDSWDNHQAWVEIDGVRIWERTLNYNADGYHTPICGFTAYRDLFIAVEAEGGHSDDEMNIKIASNLDEDANNESWGVRDFFLFYSSCA